ncbi:ATP-binding cassette domain-containing protein [Geitlerinema sp. PCC 9228]|jgi:putative ABC transport system ATP-binding protein|uniref:ABC transporter ATP-binding protein n=1 Tax=Geitlerinema sp. PCC 9228 TaxID=111611 RepID=UPI0008F9B5E0|nr:ATP-binding cassette domain-containing protein [Geitlerinema sp. PCC 9228]
MESVLVARSLARQVDNRWLWRGLHFELPAGCQLGLVGETGTGKSLLLRSLAGLDPIQEGTIWFRDVPQSQWSMPAYRAGVVYLQQQPALLEGTVEENFQAVYRLKVHRSQNYRRDRILPWLERLERDRTFLERSVMHLSGGERQLVALVRALQIQPQILLLDEPTAALDGETAQKVEAAIASWLQGESNRACIWTSHDREQIHRVTDQRLVLSKFADLI